MPKNKEGHGIVLDDKGQEQPKDRARAQSSGETLPRPHAAAEIRQG
jgi:hypothetical protein